MASVIKCDTLKSTTGNTAITISESGVPQLQVPAFRVGASAAQNATSGQYTQVALDDKTSDVFFDTNNWFNTSTYRYIPQIAGYYSLTGRVRIAGTSQTGQWGAIYKNGSIYIIGTQYRFSVSQITQSEINTLVYFNGSTDYVELWGYVAATSPTFAYTSSSVTSTLEGFLVRAA